MSDATLPHTDGSEPAAAGAGALPYHARVERLLALIAELNAATTPAAVARTVLHAARHIAGASVAYVGVRSPDGETLELLDQVGLPERVAERIRRVPIGAELPICAAARSGEPVFFDTQAEYLAAWPAARSYYDGAPTYGGAIATLPLLGRTEPIGALVFRYRTEFVFGDELRGFLLALAGLAAQALDRVRLLAAAEAERERANAAAEQVRRLQAVSDVLAAHLALDALLPEALERVRAALDADLAAVTLLEPGGTHLRVRAVVGIEPAEFAGLRIPVGQGFGGVVAATGRPWVVPDCRDIEVVGPVVARHGITALAGVPLAVADRVIGTLTIGAKRRREFPARELELLEQVAARIAVAVDRSQAHDELRRRKNEFESLVEHSPDVIARLDRGRRHVYVNRAMVAASGGRMTPELLLGKTQEELGVPEPTLGRTREAIERVFATGRPERFTFESVSLWGPGHVDLLVAPEFGLDGRTVEHVLLIARDVTALRRTMDQLARSEARLRATLSALDTISWQYDPEAHEAWHSDGAHALFGLDPAAGPVTLDAWAALVAPDDRESATAAMRDAFERQGEFAITYRIRPPGGGVRWMTSRGRYVRLPDERGVERPFMVGTTTDVTEQQRAAHALRASEMRYRSLFESELLGVGLWRGSARTGGRIVEANDALLALLGFTRDEFEAGLVTTARIAPPELRVNEAKAFRELRTIGRCTPYEREYLAKDGTRVPVLVGSVLLRPQGVAPADVPEDELEIVFYMLDMREVRAARERLIEGQRLEAIGQLAGGVAHDFNNLLVAMLGFASLAERTLRDSGTPASDPALRDIAEVQRAAERAADLTRQLLAFSRRQRLQPSRQDLCEVVRGFDRVLRQALGTDKSLVLELPAEEMPAEIDRGQLEQVLLNLTLNARDAMEAGGRLTLRVRPDASGQRIVLEVEDTGHGMDAATQARIFEPFFTTKGLRHGTGLGLATVYGIVTQSGGEITVESTPGVGTRFTLSFARSAAAERADEAAPAQRGAPGHGPEPGAETVLLVDDEPMIRAFAEVALAEHGYRVVTAEHGREALALLEAGAVRPDVVVTDLMMPELDGRAFGERLAQRHPTLPVIYTSGYTPEALQRAGRLPAQQWFVQKPWTAEQLVGTIRAALDPSAAGRGRGATGQSPSGA